MTGKRQKSGFERAPLCFRFVQFMVLCCNSKSLLNVILNGVASVCIVLYEFLKSLFVLSGTPRNPPSGILLPDKRTLELILDKLQKYGVSFSISPSLSLFV